MNTPTHDSFHVLSPAERATLRAVCDTLLPPMSARGEDDATLFALSGLGAGVDGAMEQAIAALGVRQRGEMRLLLRMMGRPAVMLALVRRPSAGFCDLPADQRERALLAMARSPLPQLRTGFQALKRLACFLFYSLDEWGKGNRTWPIIGYTPSPRSPACPPALKLTRLTSPALLDCDICVVGSGSGGGVVAAELAAAGRRVIVLEAGAALQGPEFDQQELSGTRALYMEQGMAATRDLSVALMAGGALGGGTTVNWQTCLRLPDGVRDEWAERSGCRHFTEPAFTRSFDAVEKRLRVGTGESVENANNAALRRGCEALGYRWRRLPRNAHGCDPAQCGYCVFGCRHGGKQSTVKTWLRDAQMSGDAVIIPQCRANRLLFRGRAVAGVLAEAIDPETGARHPVRVRAGTVVAAAGALHTPALLMRSGLRLPALGRNLFLHPTTAVAGRYPERIESWTGPPQTILCDEFEALDGGYGVRLETAPPHPGLLAMATPWFGARDHRRRMQHAAHVSPFIALVRDRSTGRVGVDGAGGPVVDYRPGRRERDHLRRGIAAAARIHMAAGAEEVLAVHSREHGTRRGAYASRDGIDAFCERIARSPVDRNHSLLFSAHQMGTCRMGRDARSAVCDENGEVFGTCGLFVADTSAFPASSGVNPMITVMALAHHTAGRIVTR